MSAVPVMPNSSMRGIALRWMPRLAAIGTGVIGALELVLLAGDAPGRGMPLGDSGLRLHAGTGFLLCGIGLYFVDTLTESVGRRWVVRAIAGAAALLAVLTLGENLTGGAWGIDRIAPASLLRDGRPPVRMTAASAVILSLGATGLVLLGKLAMGRLRTAAIASASAFLIGTGLLVLGANAVDLVLGHAGGSSSGVATHTAVAAVLLGLGEFAIVVRRQGWAWALERTTTIYFVTGIALLIGVGAVAYRALRAFADTAARVAQTHQIQAETGALQLALLEAVQARRAYLTLPEERHVMAFREKALRAGEHLTNLARLTADNPRQRSAIAELEAMLAGPITRAAQIATTGGLELPAQPVAPAAPGRTSISTDELLNLLNRINAEERAQLRGREQQAKRTFDLALAVVPAGGCASVLLLSMALFLLNREADERRRSHAGLLESERRYQLLFESSPLPMWVFDRGTLRFLAVNKAACEFYGYSRAEFLAMGIQDIRPAEEVPLALEVTTAPQPPGIFHSPRTWKHRKKDGTITLMEVSSHDLEIDGRQGRLVLANDVTARVEAETKLAAERSLLRTVIDLLPDFIYVKDRESRFVTANAACARFMGVTSPQEIVGRTDAEFYDAETAAIYRADEGRALAGQPVVDKEEYNLVAGSAPRNVLTTKVPLRDASGNVVGIVGTARDITAQKAAEFAIRQLNAELERRVQQRTAQLEEAIEELESFSYSVSHDLRAPLRHVQGYVALLERATEGQLSERARRHLNVINESSVQMGRLIDDLLDFSRMRRVEMSEARIGLDELLRDTLRGLELATQGRNIVWKIEPLPEVIGDAAMIRQVLANLVDNAVKYTRQRDPAEIQVGCAGDDNGQAVVFVRDNGAGFDMTYATKLFGVFQRLHRADEFEGTGIGLATVRRVISRHGGRVWAEGAVGKGATFYFTLRRAGRPNGNQSTA